MPLSSGVFVDNGLEKVDLSDIQGPTETLDELRDRTFEGCLNLVPLVEALLLWAKLEEPLWRDRPRVTFL